MNVGSEIILQLIQNQPHLALLSNDSTEVISKSERDAIHNRLGNALSRGVISRSEFAAQTNIHSKSLELLLDDREDQLVHYDDHMCTKTYDNKLSDEALDIITRIISNTT